MHHVINEIVIETASGKIRGTDIDGICYFYGIPYCTAGRFEKPVEVRDFAEFAGADGIFDATVGELDCPQREAYVNEAEIEPHFYHDEFRGLAAERRFAESPMTLNIVCPRRAINLAKTDQKSPVLAFIHGGGFETGMVGELPYGRTAEYANRGLVYVSIGYRLNIFGQYEGGNFGLYDQLTAVDWLRDNLPAFGGDISKITLMGQSAGAMSITDLLYSDLLDGKICGAVLMSGGGSIPFKQLPFIPRQTEAFWQRVRDEAGVTEDSVKTVSAEVLWHAWNKVAQSAPVKELGAKIPVVDGGVIPKKPFVVEARRSDLDIPLIIGVTSQDFIPPILYKIAMKRALRAERIGYAPVYGYFFDRELPGNSYKAFHACDLWYMFGNMDQSWRPFKEADYKLAAKMMDYVTNFVRTGDPNGEDSNKEPLPKWPAIGAEQKGFLAFDIDREDLAYPKECKQKLWYTVKHDPGPM